jgi:hypothetical protein
VRRYFRFWISRSRAAAKFFAVAAATLGLGLAAGAMLRPPPQAALPTMPALAATSTGAAGRSDRAPARSGDRLSGRGRDTFEARVRVWPGLDVDTRVRLRGVDAAELHPRCAGELAQAQAARTAMETILAEGGVTISRRHRQIWQAGRCDDRNPRHRRRVGGATQRRLRAQLRRQQTRLVVRVNKGSAIGPAGHQKKTPRVLPEHRLLAIAACRSLNNDDARANADAAVKVLDVRVVHADAAMRHETADRTFVVGAVDGVLATTGESHRSDAHRILR